MIGLLLASLIATPPAVSVPPPAPFRSRQERRPGDLAPCPGINPAIRRPRGSNCLGILPRQCGADQARVFIGRVGSPQTRAAVSGLVGHQRIRWIRLGEAVTADLRPDRLNIELDRRGWIAAVDCY